MMILNPSHEITLKGLPSDILDAYVRYKKGSRAIVSWLVQFSPQKYRKVKTLPIKELASLAKSVTDSIKELPEVIHFHFKETIAARKRLSKYFRSSIDLSEDDQETVNHEHFTTSLTKIYSDLCDHCQQCRAQKQISSQLLCQAGLAEPIRNHYACLPVEESFDNLQVDNQESDCDECQHGQNYHCPGSQAELEIENDEISIAIETASILERIHETVMVAQSCWARAGNGDAHFVSAAGATNVAWATVRELETKLRNEKEDLNLSVLHQRCCLFRDAAADSNSALAKVHALLESLTESDRAITHYSDCHKLKVIAHCPSCVQKPSDYVQHTASSENEQTTSFPLALVDNILHLMCGARPPTVILQSSPVFADIGYLLTHQEDKSTAFRCVLAIHVLTTCYKAFLSALPMPTTTATCRITALKLSKQASSTIDKVLNNKDSFPCRCPQTIAFHLSNLKDDMNAYAKHKVWDLYFQSPWVAGNHTIEMLDMLSYYGMRLFHYRHYVGAVLHSYNVLTQLAGVDKIPILEQLCDIFKDVFFPSGRPTTHFKNSWARYIGARLKFKKGHKRHGGNDRDSWCMAVPAHAARNAAGLGIETDRSKEIVEPKCDYARLDPMMKLKQLDWRIDVSGTTTETANRSSSLSTTTTNTSSRPSSSRSTEQLSLQSTPNSTNTSSLLSPSSSPSPPQSPSTPSFQHDNTSNDNTHDHTHDHSLLSTPHPLQTLLTNLNEHITPTSPCPSTSTSITSTTRLNHLSIFSTSVNIINNITTKTHTDPSEKEIKNCICFAHTLLSGADRIVEGRRFGGVECWKKEERTVVESVKEVLRDTFGESGNQVAAGVEKEWAWDL